MAITFGNRIGGNTSGAWAAYPISDSAGGTAVGIIRGDMATGAVTSAVGATALTILSASELAAMTSLLKSLIANGAPTTNALSFLRALVGVGGLTNSDDITLTAVNIAGTNWELRATLTAAGSMFAYVPNSAACGLYTGFSSAGAPVPVIPTTSRAEYVANVPGLYLPGVACLVAPNFGEAVTIDPPQCGGFAQIQGVTASRVFRVEKTSVYAPAAIGSGLLIFDLSFPTNANTAIQFNRTPANYTIATGELIRIVNPVAADADLADVAISLVGTAVLA